MNWRQLTLGCMAACAVGCSSAVPAATVTHETTPMITDAVTQTIDAFSALANMQSLQSAMAGFSTAAGTLTGGAPSNPNSSFYVLPGVRQAVSKYRAVTRDSSMDTAAQVGNFLTNQVFVASNIESTNPLTYKLDGATLCGADVDPNCAVEVNKVQIRIVVIDNNNALNFAVELGPNKINPINVTAATNPNSLEVSLDLAAAKQAITYIDSVTPDAGSTDLPAILAGVLDAKVTVYGKQNVALNLSVTKTVQLGDANGHLFTALTAPQLFGARVNGPASQGNVTLDANVIEYTAPWSDFANNSNATGTGTVHVGGASLAFALSNASTDLTLTNVGLGRTPTTLTHNGTTLLNLTIDNGGTFSVASAPDATSGSATFTFTPNFVLALGLTFQSVANDIWDLPSYFLNDTYTVSLTGNGSATVLPKATGLDVTVGALTLTHASAQSTYTVSVPTNSCLMSNPNQSADPVFGSFASGNCN